MTDFQGEISSGDKRRALVALRNLLAESMDDLHSSLKSNSGLCRRCGGSLSEAGLASLAQRLTQVMDALEGMSDPNKKLSKLDELRIARDKRMAASGDAPRATLGTKHAQRRTGSRRTGSLGGSASGPVAGHDFGEEPDSTA